MRLTTLLNQIISILFILCYFYQFFYIVVVALHRSRRERVTRLHRFAVICSARNEEAVIGQLVESVLGQDYPADLVDMYVVADNCTDRTAQAARDAGAYVLERFNQTEKGKGYALDYLFTKIFESRGQDAYDAYIIFDADNLLKKDYLRQMNACLCQGHKIITSCRNTKNYGDNWISAAYGLWFLRESKFLNEARMYLHTSAVVAGTGFLVHKDIIKENGGWKYHLLSEDTEFTVDQVLKGRKVAYCPKAMFYDEQPTDFRQSVHQRLRWSKGYFQVLSKYRGHLLDGGFASYDIVMTNLPAMLLTLAGLGVNLVALVLSFFGPPIHVVHTWDLLVRFVLGSYTSLLLAGGVTLVSMWKDILAPAWKKLVYFPLYPLFIFTYLPISVAALFCKVEWTGIQHHAAKKVLETK